MTVYGDQRRREQAARQPRRASRTVAPPVVTIRPRWQRAAFWLLVRTLWLGQVAVTLSVHLYRHRTLDDYTWPVTLPQWRLRRRAERAMAERRERIRQAAEEARRLHPGEEPF